MNARPAIRRRIEKYLTPDEAVSLAQSRLAHTERALQLARIDAQEALAQLRRVRALVRARSQKRR